MTTQTHSAVELEELLAEEIPCGGVREQTCARTCGRPAVLKAHAGHACAVVFDHPAAYKCLACWKVWYAGAWSIIAKYGDVVCADCWANCTTPEQLSDFRPF